MVRLFVAEGQIDSWRISLERATRYRRSKTNTVDYAVVSDGEIWLELDDGKTVHLKKGDVVVQNGTRHAWRNKGIAPVTMLFFLNGAKE